MTVSELEQYLSSEAEIFLSSPVYDAKTVAANAGLQPALNALREAAGRLKGEPLCELPFHDFCQYDTCGNRLSYENVYFHRRRCLGSFALMAWLKGTEEWIRLTGDYLWAVCNEFTWALPAHLDGNSLNERVNPLTLDLFACETAQTLAEICWLLQDQLSPAVLLRCRREVERRILNPFLSRKAPLWWEDCHINWAAVCGGSIGMAAIYLIQEPSILANLLSQLLPVMEHFLSGFKADGACLEGLSYWTYGMSYFTAFADLLARRTGGRLKLLTQEKCRAIAAFQGKCYFSGGHTVSFSDASCQDTFRPGVTAYLWRYFDGRLPIPPASSAAAFGADPCARWCQMLRDFVWTEDFLSIASDQADGSCSLSQSCILPDAQWMVFRDADGCGGAIKGGHNDEPHNHNDVGSFFFLLHGSEVLADLGAGEYTKDSFSERRYTIFTNQSLSHSVPVICGRGQQNGRDFKAEDCHFSLRAAGKDSSSVSAEGVDAASMDIAAAYGEPSLLSLRRTLQFDPGSHRLTLCDSFRFKGPCSAFEERFVTRQKPMLRDGSVLFYSEACEACTLAYDSSLLTASLSVDTHRRHEDGAEEIIYLLRLTPNQAAEHTALTLTLSWA